MTNITASTVRTFPLRGWLGIALVAVFWTLSWSLPGLRTHWCFFPLWLGYCLAFDAWSERRTGTSLWARSHTNYVAFFLASVPVWWLFELINRRLANWNYLGRGEFSDLEYFVLASVSFSTVIPAVFGTAEWVRSLGWMDQYARGWRLEVKSVGSVVVVGIVLLLLCLVWPLYFFPFVWLSLFFIVDPVNERLGNPSILRFLRVGDWRPVVSLALGSLICGFFWELWNFYSYPKWQYEIPFVDFLKVFEMPILGYAGYVPFSLELYALYHLLAGFGGKRGSPLKLGE